MKDLNTALVDLNILLDTDDEQCAIAIKALGKRRHAHLAAARHLEAAIIALQHSRAARRKATPAINQATQRRDASE